MGEYLFIFAGACSLTSGCLLLWLNPRRGINQMFFLASLWIAFWFFSVVMTIHAGLTQDSIVALDFWLRANAAIGAFFPSILWLMRSVIVQERRDFRSLVTWSLPWFIFSSGLASLAFTDSFILSSGRTPPWPRGTAYIVFATLLVGAAFIVFFNSLRWSHRLTGVRKIEMQFLVLAPAAASMLLVTANAAGNLLGFPWVRRLSPVWFLAMHAIAMWTISYYRIFDAKQMMASVAQKLVIFVAAIGTASLFLFPLSARTSETMALSIAAGVSCGTALLLASSTKKIFGLDAKQRLVAPRQQIIEWARQEPDEERLKLRFAELLRDWSQSERTELISAAAPNASYPNSPVTSVWINELVTKEGWITPESLQRRKPTEKILACLDFLSANGLGALLTVPKGNPNPSLVVTLGTKTSLRPYTFPDIQLLLELAELMDNTLMHSRVAAHAAKLERMESAMMMSRGLAHDLNNLVTPVSTFLMHMEDRVASGTSEAAVFSDAKHSLKVMESYIRESLFFARQLNPEFEEVDSAEILKSVIALTGKRAADHQIRVALGTVGVGRVRADKALLQRLLQNLVYNAIDASREGQSIEISSQIAESTSVEFLVCDHGTGIPAELTQRIFEPYFTTKGSKSETRGLGLGLAISRKIVDLHGGHISSSPNQPQGTVFLVRLPRSDLPDLSRFPKTETMAGPPAAVPTVPIIHPVELL
jgi:signal transduction histidine kinase